MGEARREAQMKLDARVTSHLSDKRAFRRVYCQVPVGNLCLLIDICRSLVSVTLSSFLRRVSLRQSTCRLWSEPGWIRSGRPKATTPF